jgi:hypothetical protein
LWQQWWLGFSTSGASAEEKRRAELWTWLGFSASGASAEEKRRAEMERSSSVVHF